MRYRIQLILLLCVCVFLMFEYKFYNLITIVNILSNSAHNFKFLGYSIFANDTDQSQLTRVTIKNQSQLTRVTIKDQSKTRIEDVIMKKLLNLVQMDQVADVRQQTSDLCLIFWNKTERYIKPKYGHYNKLCTDPYDNIQDLFCMHKLPYLENVKNPCWYEESPNEKAVLRCLPYYHILGCAKCATTDLYFRLTSHPHILHNDAFLGKEALWWSWKKYGINNYNIMEATSIEDYANNFKNTASVLSTLIKNNNATLLNKIITGDASPPDFWDFRAWPLIPQNEGLAKPEILTPHLMQQVYRNSKFILLLRNPAERLYSDYFFLRQGNDPHSFHDDVVTSVSTIMDCLAKHTVQHCFYSSKIFSKLKCRLHFGCYVVFLEEWLKVFDRRQFYITRTEDYSKDIDKHLAQIYKFLEVDALSKSMLDNIEAKDKKRVSWRKRKFPLMLKKTRKILDKFYLEYNVLLAKVLGSKKYMWPESNFLSSKRQNNLEKFKHIIAAVVH